MSMLSTSKVWSFILLFFDSGRHTHVQRCNVFVDCPVKITIRPPGGNVSVGTTFTCSADAYPQASYQWTGANGTANNDTFQLNQEGNYTLTCTATNYLSGYPNGRCQDTLTVDGTTYGGKIVIVHISPQMRACGQ